MKALKFIEFFFIGLIFLAILAKELNALDCRQFVFAPQCRGVSKKSLDFDSSLLNLNDDKINELKSQINENKLIRILLNNLSKELNGKDDEKDQII